MNGKRNTGRNQSERFDIRQKTSWMKQETYAEQQVYHIYPPHTLLFFSSKPGTLLKVFLPDSIILVSDITNVNLPKMLPDTYVMNIWFGLQILVSPLPPTKSEGGSFRMNHFEFFLLFILNSLHPYPAVSNSLQLSSPTSLL